MKTTTVRNNRGNVLVQILVATAVMSISFYFLTTYVIGQKKQITKTINAVSLRFALNSTMDYVIFGVRQKWCFLDNTIVLNPTCDLTTANSVERLIMSDDQANFIKQMIAAGVSVGPVDPNNLSLSNFTMTLKPDLLTTSHPLFAVMQKLKTVKDEITGKIINVAGVQIQLAKDTSAYLPRAGREVYLTIKIALLDSSSNVIQLANNELSLKSSIAIYPREVGSFALLMPQDLHLDVQWNAAMATGDVGLHQFNSRKDLGTGPGLVFLSPVFVNRDIYLPQIPTSTTATADNSPYSAVTFADRVYLGSGWIKSVGASADDQYVPRTSGGLSDRYWSDATSFGGFLRGIENDGAGDEGLKYFGNILSGVVPDTSLLAQCTALSAAQASRVGATSLKLGASVVGGTTTDQKSQSIYKLFFNNTLFNTSGNFSQQTNAIGNPTKSSNWGSGSVDYDGDNTGAVVNVSFSFDGKVVSQQMPLNSSLTIVPEVGSSALKASYAAAVANAQTNLNNANNNLDSLNAQLTAAKSSLTKAKSDLSDEQAKPIKTTTASSNGSSGSNSGNVDLASTSADTTSTDTGAGSGTGTDAGSGTGTDTASSPTPTPSASPSPTPVDTTVYQDPKVISDLQAKISDLQAGILNLTNNLIPAQNTIITNAQAALASALSDQSNYNNIVSNPPTIEIDVNAYTYTKRNKTYNYYDRVQVVINAKNVKNLLDSNGNVAQPSIGILGYDNTYYKGQPILNDTYTSANPSLQGYLNYTLNSTKKQWVPPVNVAATSTSAALNINPAATDMDTLEQQCEDARNAMSSQSFGGAAWNVSFANTTRHSWNFADPTGAAAASASSTTSPVLDTLVFGAGVNSKFTVASIVGNCVIPAETTFITGFFSCDKLTINARTKPLRIIATFIVGKLFIEPTAYTAGITWSSIYYPQATRELRAAGTLHTLDGQSCDAVLKSPIWHPIPSVQELSNLRACNTISLRAQADPFQWTAVDPDCGMVSNPTTSQSNTTCKKRLVKFYVVEQARESGI